MPRRQVDPEPIGPQELIQPRLPEPGDEPDLGPLFDAVRAARRLEAARERNGAFRRP